MKALREQQLTPQGRATQRELAGPCPCPCPRPRPQASRGHVLLGGRRYPVRRQGHRGAQARSLPRLHRRTEGHLRGHRGALPAGRERAQEERADSVLHPGRLAGRQRSPRHGAAGPVSLSRLRGRHLQANFVAVAALAGTSAGGSAGRTRGLAGTNRHPAEASDQGRSRQPPCHSGQGASAHRFAATQRASSR